MSNANSTLYDGEADQIASARKYTQANGLADPYRAYAAHRNSARIRGIAWGFTFTSWWEIWQPYFHIRGRGTNDLCMAREMDEGGYTPGNVYLTTHLGNARDAVRAPNAIERRKLAKETKEMRFARQPSGRFLKSGELKSTLALNRSSQTDKYACNQTEGELKYE